MGELEHLACSGAIQNFPLSTATIQDMGGSIPFLQGKLLKKNQTSSPETRSMRRVEETTLYGDLMYITPNIDRLDFVILTSDFGVTFVRPVKSRGTPQTGLTLSEIFSQFKTYFLQIIELKSDRESGIAEITLPWVQENTLATFRSASGASKTHIALFKHLFHSSWEMLWLCGSSSIPRMC